jgi:hypothetical protein
MKFDAFLGENMSRTQMYGEYLSDGKIEISDTFYSSPPTDISLPRSNLPRSLYIFGIVVALLLVASNKSKIAHGAIMLQA